MKKGSCFKKISSWLKGNALLLGALASVFQIILLPMTIAGGFLIYLQILGYYKKADLHMTFSNPASLNFTLINDGDVLAEGPFRGFIVFDLNTDSLNPLPIPFQETSYIREGTGQGGTQLLEEYAVRGHRYFGYAKVFCKNCATARSYAFHVVHGQKENAWYVPLQDKDRIPLTPEAIKLMREKPDEVLLSFFPDARRVEIK